MSDVPGRLLRDTLQSRMSDESGGCLDAETLAAWADGALSRAARGAAERHAAGCARCQSMLAAMARTAPPAVLRSWWRSPLGWIVPLTAAAALLVWMELPRPARQAAPQIAALRTVAAPAVEAESPAVVAPSAVPPLSRVERADRPNSKRSIDADKDVAAVQANAAKEAFDTGLAKRTSDTRAAAPAEQAFAPTLREAAAASAAAAALATPSLGAPAAAPPAAAPSSAPPAAAPTSGEARASQVLVSKDASAAQARIVSLDARRQASEIAIPSSNANSRWRITGAGLVQHSSDGGTTWDTQATGAPAALTAGMSPSPSVCWLVGPRGLVLLSTDARSWKRIPFPEMADLTAVRAADEKTATVTTSDGRPFTTRDGGSTWGR